MTKLRSLILVLLSLAPVGFTQVRHPETYIDRGACPFECCTYQRWNTLKDTVAYASPDKNARRVGLFKKGSRVRGMTGEVRTTSPGKLVIIKPHDKFKIGDILWVYTPEGEGNYKVWFKGKMFVTELPYVSGPYETSYPSCDQTPECWGKLENQLKTVWWAKLRSPAGWIGWTDQTENFGNMDSCG